MFNWLSRRAPAPTPAPAPEPRASVFTTEIERDDFQIRPTVTLPRPSHVVGEAMDDNLKSAFALGQTGVPDVQAIWYGSQGFIGYQVCALMAQNWLINKACLIPARDAVRKGFKVTVNDGSVVDPDVLAAIEKANKRFKLNRSLVEYVKMGRVFGVRVALTVVESADPDYYVKPFNPDGVTPGSYRGISQIDPYWCVPELSSRAASDPSALDFYEPTYWVINGKRHHKSHLSIMRGPEVADVLKPSYLYGGLSVPQMIYERVYAAERTANEAPQLAMTKRSTVLYTDAAKALANQAKFEQRLNTWTHFRDNFGVKVLDKDADKAEQMDTSLADLDAVIMTQYQIVAAAANIPATKLLGTTPKGFNSTGDYESDSYHEELESIQTNDLEPLIDRHLLCVIRSDIAPRFNIKPFGVECTWHPVSTLSATEQAAVNKVKAETDKLLADSGAIDGADIRARVVADEHSGHDGMAAAVPEDAHVAPAGGAFGAHQEA